MSPRHSAQVGSEVLGDEEMTHQLLRQRINEGFARQQIVNSLIEGVVLAHEKDPAYDFVVWLDLRRESGVAVEEADPTVGAPGDHLPILAPRRGLETVSPALKGRHGRNGSECGAAPGASQ